MSGALTAVKVVGVFLLLAATLMYIRRHDRGRLRVARKSQRPVSVLGQARLSKAASVAVVDIGGTAYAVAVTDQRVSLLLPDPVEVPEIEPAAQPTPAALEAKQAAPPEPRQPRQAREPREPRPARRYVGRFERAARATGIPGANAATGTTASAGKASRPANRPSFGEALAQQFRVLTRRETAVPLSELPVRNVESHDDTDFDDPDFDDPDFDNREFDNRDFDAELAGFDGELNDDLNSVTMLIPAVAPAADGSAADTAARTPGTFPG